MFYPFCEIRKKRVLSFLIEKRERNNKNNSTLFMGQEKKLSNSPIRAYCFMLSLTAILLLVFDRLSPQVKLSFERFDDIQITLNISFLHLNPLQPITLPPASRTASPGATTSLRSAGTAFSASADTM